jgi:hypothetical protein
MNVCTVFRKNVKNKQKEWHRATKPLKDPDPGGLNTDPPDMEPFSFVLSVSHR